MDERCLGLGENLGKMGYHRAKKLRHYCEVLVESPSWGERHDLMNRLQSAIGGFNRRIMELNPDRLRRRRLRVEKAKHKQRVGNSIY